MKRRWLFIFAILAFLIGTTNVQAACNDQELLNLANSVTASFEETPINYVMHYNLKFNNLSDKLYIVITNTFDDTRTTVMPSNFVNGSAEYLTDVTSLKVTYTGVVYSNIDNCKHEALNTVRYTTPIYNPYYTDPVCIQNPGAAVCQKYIDSLPDLDKFYESVNNYATNPQEATGKELVTNPYHNTDACKGNDDFEYCKEQVLEIPEEEEFNEALSSYEDLDLNYDDITAKEEKELGIEQLFNVKDKITNVRFWIAMGVVAVVTTIIVITIILKRKNRKDTVVGEMK